MDDKSRRMELGELIGDIARMIESPEAFADADWQGVSYPDGENVTAANVREFLAMLDDARRHCVALPNDENVQRALETIEYAAFGWEFYTNEWFAENEDDDQLLTDCINASCQYTQEGCSVPLRTLAAKLIAAGRLERGGAAARYSRARSPADWCKILAKLESARTMSPSTFTRRTTEGNDYFRYHRSPDSSSKSVKLLLSDLGTEYDDTQN